MKLLATVALAAMAAGGVHAVDPKCQANYILERCKSLQNVAIDSCAHQDWDCLCPAYQALRTCYNNCPMDPVIPQVDGQVTIFCQNAHKHDEPSPAADDKSGSDDKPNPSEEAPAPEDDGDDDAQTYDDVHKPAQTDDRDTGAAPEASAPPAAGGEHRIPTLTTSLRFAETTSHRGAAATAGTSPHKADSKQGDSHEVGVAPLAVMSMTAVLGGALGALLMIL